MARSNNGPSRAAAAPEPAAAPPAGADAPSTATPAAADAPAPTSTKTWRRVALCMRGCRAYFGGALTQVLGGEWVTDVDRVKVIERDPHFRLIDVSSPDDLRDLMAAHSREIEDLKLRATQLGFVAIPEGLVQLPRR